MYTYIYIYIYLSIFIYNIYNIYIYISAYPQTRVSYFPGLISKARVNKQRTNDVTRVL